MSRLTNDLDKAGIAPPPSLYLGGSKEPGASRTGAQIPPEWFSPHAHPGLGPNWGDSKPSSVE